MKIFLSFLQSIKQHPIPTYSFWEYYIKNGIEEAGVEYTECADVDWATGLVPQTREELNKWKSITWEKTLRKIKLERPEIFLSYLYPHQIDEQAIAEIKKLGVFCVNFFCDHIREYTIVPKEFKIFDLNWVPEYKALQLYKNAGLNFIHLPMPMWVEPKFRIISPIETQRISFIGSRDIQRQTLFQELVNKQELNLEIYGAGWVEKESKSFIKSQPIDLIERLTFQYAFFKQFGINAYLRKIQQRNYHPKINEHLMLYLKEKISFEKYIKITQESMITLGVNRYPDFRFPLNAPNTYSRLRDIEAPMLGACYLTEWTEGLDTLYDLEKEIEIYKNVDDLIEKINMLDKDAYRRSMLRINGQRRALHNHSIPHAINQILNHANFKLN